MATLAEIQEQQRKEQEDSSQQNKENLQDTTKTLTEKPKETPIDKDRIIQAQMAVIGDYRKELDNLKSDITNLRADLTKKPEPTSAEVDKKFWTNPSEVLKQHEDKIVGQLKEIVAPLQALAGEIRSGSALSNIKNKLKSQNPVFAEVIDHPELGPMIDAALNGKEVNEGNVKAIIYGIRGAVDAGDIQVEIKKLADTTTTEIKDTRDMSRLPPHLRPSAPAAPSNREQPKKREYTENEKRLMREQRLTEEEWESYGGGAEIEGRSISTFRVEDFESPAEKKAREAKEKGGK